MFIFINKCDQKKKYKYQIKILNFLLLSKDTIINYGLVKIFPTKDHFLKLILIDFMNKLGSLVQEVHLTVNEWISEVIRTCSGDRKTEFHWLVGPIDI